MKHSSEIDCRYVTRSAIGGAIATAKRLPRPFANKSPETAFLITDGLFTEGTATEESIRGKIS